MRPSSFAISSTETQRYSSRADQLLVKATSTPAPAVHPSLLPEMVLKAPLIPPAVTIKSSDTLASAAPAVTYGRIQSKATPNLARPVRSDLSLTDSLAKQPGVEHAAAKLARCPVHWASSSAPNTAHPACQLNPIWPPAIAPLSLPEPPRLVLLSSVGPSPCGVVNTPEMKPFGPRTPNWVPAPDRPRTRYLSMFVPNRNRRSPRA